MSAAEFLAAVEVKHDAFREWIDAMNPQAPVRIVFPHVRDEMVVQLKAHVPAEWALEAV